MKDVVESVERVAQMIETISHSSAEQSNGMSQMNGAVNELEKMTQQNSALVEESTAAAQALREQATRLTELVGAFQLTSDRRLPFLG